MVGFKFQFQLEDGMIKLFRFFNFRRVGSFRVIPGHHDAAVTVPRAGSVLGSNGPNGPGLLIRLSLGPLTLSDTHGHPRPGPEPNRSSL